MEVVLELVRPVLSGLPLGIEGQAAHRHRAAGKGVLTRRVGVPAAEHIAGLDRLRQRGYLGIVYAFTAANGVLFALFFPVLTGVTIPRDYAWNVLKWLPDWPF